MHHKNDLLSVRKADISDCIFVGEISNQINHIFFFFYTNAILNNFDD